ncbi:MAG: efflux RND transporter periplasmic adaptor subunit [Armatimonadota bacterium]
MDRGKERTWKIATIVMAVLFVGSVGLWVATHVGGGEGAGPGGQVWHCPMHPEYTSDGPGECPICGMDLVPVEEAAPTGAMTPEEEMAMESGVPGLEPITITPKQEQYIGVRTGAVERQVLTKALRTVGLVKPDETRLSELNAKVAGWIEALYVNATGELVNRGEPLLAIYSPELVATQEEYLLALRGREQLKDSPFPEIARSGDELVASAERRLRLWDISEGQLRQLRETRKPRKTLTLYAPFTGFVMHRTATEGMHVTAGMELFKLADLSKVWVEADLYEQEIPHVEEGQRATISVKGVPGKTYTGVIDYIYPYLEGPTRTVKARFVVANPGFTLKPDMYADVEMEIPLGERLAVPTEAVIDTGERQVVFVALGEGRYVPREIRVGDRVDNWYPVESGLEEGDKVVTSGQFMIDSESRLKAAIAARAGGDESEAEEEPEHSDM